MLKLERKNSGTNCFYIAIGNTVDDVKKNAAEHAQKVHKDLLAKMTPQQIDEMYKTVTRMTHLPYYGGNWHKERDAWVS